MSNGSNLNKLIKTKIALADQECESETRKVISGFYSEIKIENGRLRLPDFQKAANAMGCIIYNKEKRFNSELGRILNVSGGFSSQQELELSQIHMREYFEESRYLNRYEKFLESVDLKVKGYGLKFERERYRTDLPSALYKVLVKNSIRRAISSVNSELEIFLNSKVSSNNSASLDAIDVIELKPNFMGIGLNLNAIYRKFMRKKT
ncbi:hypothetical protein ACMZOO_05140 [Catenovulum sp. SX2]|uniref:hypothetical protein n=1 Tax=Catenovulum sp. SX2 TaxID=3398614 RepID=UPI003F8335C3